MAYNQQQQYYPNQQQPYYPPNQMPPPGVQYIGNQQPPMYGGQQGYYDQPGSVQYVQQVPGQPQVVYAQGPPQQQNDGFCGKLCAGACCAALCCCCMECCKECC